MYGKKPYVTVIPVNAKGENTMKIKKVLAVLFGLAVMTTGFSACSKEEDKSSEAASETTVQTQASTEATEEKAGDTIYFMSDYDLNPSYGQERSIALTLFEDVYGGKIEWIPTTQDTMFDDLSKAVLGGDEVDMFPYCDNALPYGVSKDLFQPLDEFVDFTDERWADIKGLADKMKYNGSYYAVPTNVLNPVVLIYNRNAVKELEMEDPYKLYEEGKWDYTAFTDLMSAYDGTGCAGWIGKGLLQATGETFVTYDGSTFTNNLESEALAEAGSVIEQMSGTVYGDTWYDYLNEDILFLGAGSWDISESNEYMKDVEKSDVFFVPFPTADGSGKNVTADINAKMLVKNSKKGEAVANYLMCERIAVTEEKYVKAAKEAEIASGLTEEQSDFLDTLRNPENVVFDFAYGMSKTVSNNVTDYEKRGAVNNINDAILAGYADAPSSWTELRDSLSEDIDKEIESYK